MEKFVSDYQYYKVAKYNQIGCSHFRVNLNSMFGNLLEGPRKFISPGADL
jgi:hypothetical protein